MIQVFDGDGVDLDSDPWFTIAGKYVYETHITANFRFRTHHIDLETVPARDALLAKMVRLLRKPVRLSVRSSDGWRILSGTLMEVETGMSAWILFRFYHEA